MNSLPLNGTWRLGTTWEFPESLLKPAVRSRCLLEAPVPAPVHQVLLDQGIIDDPNIGLHSLQARWVEEQVWVYRRTFEAPEDALAQTAWLAFDGLDLDAQVFLNGEKVGEHHNAHRPARFEVTGKLRVGENLLAVLLDSGLRAAIDKPAGDYDNRPPDQMSKRMFLRKPQYQSGWDWNPRLMGVGITGDVRLEWTAVPRLGQVTVFAIPADDLQTATMHVRATLEGIADAPAAALLRVRIVETGQTADLLLDVAKGESRRELTITLDKPELWWPAGHGAQALYTVEVTLESAGETQTASRRTGVRKVTVDQSPHPVAGTHFIVTINNRPIFCKGGNWVPPDLLPARVPAERTRALVALAREQHFNLLRIWGGAVYVDHVLGEACDEQGVLIWHDLLFACCKYPADDPKFAAEVRTEVTYAMRELAHHPSIVVWCGNNEIEWGDQGWGYDGWGRTHPHYYMFHHDLPLIAQREDPAAFYWISSPSSPGLEDPNDPTVGDQHPWLVSFEDGPAAWWTYRTCVDRFPNEGGVLGMSSLGTLRQFLPGSQCALGSLAWEHHDNTLSHHITPDGTGRPYATMRHWLGIDPLALDWQTYAMASGVLQADGLTEYITNYRRRMFSSASAIFWMYNDSWPATHSWTTVDYYLRRKLAFYAVKRAFQPVTVVVAHEDDAVRIYGVNDTPQDWRGQVRYGLFALAGGYPRDEQAEASLPANSSTLLAEFPTAEWDAAGVTAAGAFAILSQGGAAVAQHRLFRATFGDLQFAPAAITVEQADGAVTLTSPTFAWGVCLDVEGNLALQDNCIDLLPGVPYRIEWPAELGEAKVLFVASEMVTESASARV